MKIGILVHGRHVNAVDWEKLMWGELPNKLGSLPLMLLVALNCGLENVAGIVFGTGASERDGVKEAQVMKNFLLGKLDDMFVVASLFETLGHPRFQTLYDLSKIRDLCGQIICETKSQNTDQEVASAAKIFADLGVDEVRQVTCGSHAPRCQLAQLKMRAAGVIPSRQLWSCYGDDMTYSGSLIGDVVVSEPPHRGDRPKTPIHLAVKRADRLGRGTLSNEFYGELNAFLCGWEARLKLPNPDS